MGDPAGIGGELTLRAWLALRDSGPCLRRAGRSRTGWPRWRARLGLDVPIARCRQPPRCGAVFRRRPCRCCRCGSRSRPSPGQPDPANAPAVIASIEQATKLALAGAAGAVVTNPINKAALYQRRVSPIPGHTEFLAALTGAPAGRS